MELKKILEIENILYEECKDFLKGKDPETEEMKACYKAYSAVQDYGMLLYEKKRSAGLAPKRTQTIYQPLL